MLHVELGAINYCYDDWHCKTVRFVCDSAVGMILTRE